MPTQPVRAFQHPRRQGSLTSAKGHCLSSNTTWKWMAIKEIGQVSGPGWSWPSPNGLPFDQAAFEEQIVFLPGDTLFICCPTRAWLVSLPSSVSWSSHDTVLDSLSCHLLQSEHKAKYVQCQINSWSSNQPQMLRVELLDMQTTVLHLHKV